MEIPELVHLTLVQVATLLVILGAIDTLYAIVVSLVNRMFSGLYVTQFLLSHVAAVWLPIFGLAVLGAGVAGLPPIPAFSDAAIASLIAYAVAVVASLKTTTVNKATPPVLTP